MATKKMLPKGYRPAEVWWKVLIMSKTLRIMELVVRSTEREGCKVPMTLPDYQAVTLGPRIVMVVPDQNQHLPDNNYEPAGQRFNHRHDPEVLKFLPEDPFQASRVVGSKALEWQADLLET